MTALLCSILCASLVNIGLAFAGRRGWDSRPVLLAAYLASTLLAGALLASARPALCWPGPAAAVRALAGDRSPEAGASFAVWFGLVSGALYLLCLRAMDKGVRRSGAGLTTMYQRLGILVPILASALLWGERPTALQWAGLAVTVAALAALWGGELRQALAGPLPVFVLGGAVELTGKTFQMCAAAEYRPLFLFVLFSLCAAAQAAELARARVPLAPGPLVLGAPLGACSLLSSLFLMSALALAAVSLVLVNL